MNASRGKTPTTWLAALLLLALALRTTGIGHPFYSNDPAEIALYSTVYYPSSPGGLMKAFGFYHGAGELLFGFAILWVYGLLGLHVTEFMWNLPYAIIGTLTVLTSYYLVLLFTRRKSTALTAALFIALYPLHVGVSRGSGYGHHTIPLFLQTLAIISAHYYYSRPNGRRALLLSTILALEILFDLIFPFILPLVLYVGMMTSKEKNLIQQSAASLRKLLMPEFILPSLVLLVKVYFLLNATGSMVYVLARPDVMLGFYPLHFIINLSYYLNPIVLAACLASLAHNVKNLSRDGARLFPAWAVIYSTPLIFMFGRCVTMHALSPTVPLLIALAVAVNDEGILSKKNRILAVSILSALLLAGTLASVYRVPGIPLQDSLGKIYCSSTVTSTCRLNVCTSVYAGRVYGDEGYKAAGYWLRENTPRNAIVFSDTYGLVMGKRKNVKYYTQRRLEGLNVGSRKSMLRIYGSNKSSYDALLIRPRNVGLFKGLGRFHKTLAITSGGKTVLFIYTREKHYSNTLPVNARFYNALFDRKYATPEQLARYPEVPD
ncbi:MAG: hypothetical protein ABIH11_02650 [Candidatus Altiarchaeota archaeon]